MGNYEEEVREAKPMITLAFYCFIVVLVIAFAYYFFIRLQPQETAIVYVTLTASALATCIAIATLVYSSYSANLERREQEKTRLRQADEIAKAAANTLYIALETKLVEFIPQAIQHYKARRESTPATTMRQIVRLRKIYISMNELLPTLDAGYLQHIEKIALLYPKATHSVFYLISNLSDTSARHSIAVHSSQPNIDALHEMHDRFEEIEEDYPNKIALQKTIGINTLKSGLSLEIDFAVLVILVTAICYSLEAFRTSEPVSIQRSSALDSAISKSGTTKARTDPSFLKEGLEHLNQDAREHMKSVEADILALEAELPTFNST